MSLININVRNDRCTVSDMRKKLAEVLSKLPGDAKIDHWNIVVRLEDKRGHK